MMKRGVVLITGADRGIGFSLCREFLAGGWKVLAGQYMPRWKELEELKKSWPDTLHLLPLDVSDPVSVEQAASLASGLVDQVDMICHVAGIAQGDSPDQFLAMYRVNSVGPLCVTENFLPLMREGGKRLCFFSSEASSISLAHREGIYAYGMSKTALNMGIRLLFNQLRPQNFTFRIYHPGWVRSYMAGDTLATVGVYSTDESAAGAYRYFTQDVISEDVLVITDVEQETWSF